MRLSGFTRPARFGDNYRYALPSNEDEDPNAEDLLGGVSIVKEYDMDLFSAPELATSSQGPAVDLYSIGTFLNFFIL
jgi:hypothetical protein